MGTRADFYTKRDGQMVWLASIAWDGYPEGIIDIVLLARSEGEYLAALAHFLKTRDDVSTPETGWPWPWEDSNTTDYAYMFDGKSVVASCFGRPWADPMNLPEDWEKDEANRPDFPNMAAHQKTTYGKRSGLIVFTAR